jgi:hypothetical protein
MESIHQVSTETIVAALGILSAMGGGLSFAVGKLWQWVDKRVLDCEADRFVLHGHIKTMNIEIQDLSRSVGHMEGTLETITKRNNLIDKKP